MKSVEPLAMLAGSRENEMLEGAYQISHDRLCSRRAMHGALVLRRRRVHSTRATTLRYMSDKRSESDR